MQIAILGGGFFARSLGSPLGLLLAPVVPKITMDVKLHLREHEKKQKHMKTAATPA